MKIILIKVIVILLCVSICPAGLYALSPISSCQPEESPEETRLRIQAEVEAEFTLEKVLWRYIQETPWELLSAPNDFWTGMEFDVLSKWYVYRCGNYILHVPKNVKFQTVIDDARAALARFGNRMVPTTILTSSEINPEAHGPNQIEIVYLQERAIPLIEISGKRFGVRNILYKKGFLSALSQKDPEKAKALIDDFFALIEDLWRSGLWIRDLAFLANTGYRDGKVVYFDLGEFYDPGRYSPLVHQKCLDNVLEHNRHILNTALGADNPLIEYFMRRGRQTLTVANAGRLWPGKKTQAETRETPPAGIALWRRVIRQEVRRRLERQTAEMETKKSL